MITKCAIVPTGYTEGDTLNVINLEGNTITNTLYYDNKTANFAYQPFTVRVYFEWYDGENETMNNEADTLVSSNKETFKINANISFEQEV